MYARMHACTFTWKHMHVMQVQSKASVILVYIRVGNNDHFNYQYLISE